MSILIKGMDMPEHCGKCRFSVGGWCYAAKDFDRARITTNSCPLVGVPTPHGRLIDADATLDTLTDYEEDRFAKLVINGSPTVIESEE